MRRKLKIKIRESLTANEILELHRKTIRKSVSRGHRVYYDTTKTIPEKVICFCYTDIFSGEVFRYWEYDKKKVLHRILISTMFYWCLTMQQQKLDLI